MSQEDVNKDILDRIGAKYGVQLEDDESGSEESEADSNDGREEPATKITQEKVAQIVANSQNDDYDAKYESKFECEPDQDSDVEVETNGVESQPETVLPFEEEDDSSGNKNEHNVTEMQKVAEASSLTNEGLIG